MSENLNENLYKRFGLEIDRRRVESGFCKYFSNRIWELTYPLRRPGDYERKYSEQLYKIREDVLDECCREMFLDRGDYEYDDVNNSSISIFIDRILIGSFEQALINLQIFLNVLSRYVIIHDELSTFNNELSRYLMDFPILGITLKCYKTRASQILPSRSKHFDKEMLDTLGVLDKKEFHNVLNDFEYAIKHFTKAKNDSDFKSVIANMHAACDEVVKVILDDKNKSFKSVMDKSDHKALGLNGDQKEIFKNLKNRMDAIKHGSSKNIDRDEVEMLINISASFIRFVASKYNNKIIK